MAWTAANLYVRDAAGRDALLDALAQQFGDAPADGLLDAPAPLLVGAPLEGWTPVIGLRGWSVNLAADARALSTRLAGATVVSVEVIGNSYQMRFTRNANGEQLERVQWPEQCWRDGEHDLNRGEMPMYRDVEQLAYALLRDQAIAPALILAGAHPYGSGDRPPIELGEAVALHRTAAADLQRSTVALRASDHQSDDAPMFPLHVGQDFGLAFVEERYVEGVPRDASVKRLLQLEHKLRDRARRLHGDKLALTVTYFNGAYQDELDALLMARGRHVPARPKRRAPVPWWQFWRFLGRWS